jgi:hypothetical protein
VLAKGRIVSRATIANETKERFTSKFARLSRLSCEDKERWNSRTIVNPRQLPPLSCSPLLELILGNSLDCLLDTCHESRLLFLCLRATNGDGTVLVVAARALLVPGRRGGSGLPTERFGIPERRTQSPLVC